MTLVFTTILHCKSHCTALWMWYPHRKRNASNTFQVFEHTVFHLNFYQSVTEFSQAQCTERTTGRSARHYSTQFCFALQSTVSAQQLRRWVLLRFRRLLSSASPGLSEWLTAELRVSPPASQRAWAALPGYWDYTKHPLRTLLSSGWLQHSATAPVQSTPI